MQSIIKLPHESRYHTFNIFSLQFNQWSGWGGGEPVVYWALLQIAVGVWSKLDPYLQFSMGLMVLTDIMYSGWVGLPQHRCINHTDNVDVWKTHKNSQIKYDTGLWAVNISDGFGNVWVENRTYHLYFTSNHFYISKSVCCCLVKAALTDQSAAFLSFLVNSVCQVLFSGTKLEDFVLFKVKLCTRRPLCATSACHHVRLPRPALIFSSSEVQQKQKLRCLLIYLLD